MYKACPPFSVAIDLVRLIPEVEGKDKDVAAATALIQLTRMPVLIPYTAVPSTEPALNIVYIIKQK